MVRRRREGHVGRRLGRDRRRRVPGLRGLCRRAPGPRRHAAPGRRGRRRRAPGPHRHAAPGRRGRRRRAPGPHRHAAPGRRRRWSSRPGAEPERRARAGTRRPARAAAQRPARAATQHPSRAATQRPAWRRSTRRRRPDVWFCSVASGSRSNTRHARGRRRGRARDAGTWLYVAGDAFAAYDLRDGTRVPWSPPLLGGTVPMRWRPPTASWPSVGRRAPKTGSPPRTWPRSTCGPERSRPSLRRSTAPSPRCSRWEACCTPVARPTASLRSTRRRAPRSRSPWRAPRSTPSPPPATRSSSVARPARSAACRPTGSARSRDNRRGAGLRPHARRLHRRLAGGLRRHAARPAAASACAASASSRRCPDPP